MSQKRKALTVAEKVEILRKYDENTTLKQNELANSLGIPHSTLRTIVTKRKEIECHAKGTGGKRKRLRLGKYEELENVLLKWLLQVRSQPSPVPLDGPALTEKALEIARKLEIDGFTASNGWLHRFKLRNGIKYLQISEDAYSVDTNYVDVDCMDADPVDVECVDADSVDKLLTVDADDTIAEVETEEYSSVEKLRELLISNSTNIEDFRRASFDTVMAYEKLLGEYHQLLRDRHEKDARIESLIAANKNIEKDLIAVLKERNICAAKLKLRPNVELLEKLVIPPWLLLSNHPQTVKWEVAIYFRLTPHAMMIFTRLQNSILTIGIFAEAMTKMYKSSSEYSPHCNEYPSMIELDDSEWKTLFENLNVKDELQQEAVKLALENLKKNEVKKHYNNNQPGFHTFLVYMDCLPAGPKGLQTSEIIEKIRKGCYQFESNVTDFYFPSGRNKKYHNDVFILMENMTYESMKTVICNLESFEKNTIGEVPERCTWYEKIM